MGRTDFLCDLAEVGRLDLGGDADKCAPQRLLGRREKHLLLNLRIVGRPDQRDRAPAARITVSYSALYVPRPLGSSIRPAPRTQRVEGEERKELGG